MVDVKIHAAGIKSFAHIQRIQKIAFQFWLAGLLCNIAAGSYTLTTVYTNAKSSGEKSPEEKKKESKYTVLLLN